MNLDALGGGFVTILGGPGKEKGRVLQGKGIDATVRSVGGELPGQSLIEAGQSSAQWMRGADDDHFLSGGY